MAEQEVGEGVGGEHYIDAYIMEKDSQGRRTKRHGVEWNHF
jgi:hypothetical protein